MDRFRSAQRWLNHEISAIRLLLKIIQKRFLCQEDGINSTFLPLALLIGTSELKMTETSAFTVFPNKGIRVVPRMILKVVDRYGQMLEDTAIKREEVLCRRPPLSCPI